MEPNAVDKYDRLPPIGGPTMPRFNNGKYKKIEYLELLGRDHNNDSMPFGTHGYVFKVLIDSKPFALKVFRFFDPETVRFQLGPRGDRVSDAIIISQTDPFYAECRAYGRIYSKKRKRPIATACHGFVGIKSTMEPVFEKRFQVTDWDRPEEELSKPLRLRQPFRALVKDLVESDPDVTDSLVKEMRQHLKALHSLRIYVLDIDIRNYKGGKLVDFSNSWTEPHIGFDERLRTKPEIIEARGNDNYQFDEMVKELGVQTAVRSIPNEDLVNRLRPRKKTA